MRVPPSLLTLLDIGIVDAVLRPLLSGKEAEVYLVSSGGQPRVAKVYKDAQSRTFKHRAQYTEGRNVRNTRDQRAMQKRTSYGRSQDESAWRSTEVDMIYRLRNAGVRVPTPHHFIDGVLIMEMVATVDGAPAPRLGEVALTRDEAVKIFDQLLAEVVRMLCAGVVHGDLSEFNVLLGADGPVIIDLPQAVDASSNQNAQRLLLRDVGNLQRFVARFAPERANVPYAQEMWELFRRNQLTPETRLGGRFRRVEQRTNTADVLSLIDDANRDEARRREASGASAQRPVVNPQRWVEVAVQPSRRGGPSHPGPRPGNAPGAPRGGHHPQRPTNHSGHSGMDPSRHNAPVQATQTPSAPARPPVPDRSPYPTLRNVPGAAAQIREAERHAAMKRANPPQAATPKPAPQTRGPQPPTRTQGQSPSMPGRLPAQPAHAHAQAGTRPPIGASPAPEGQGTRRRRRRRRGGGSAQPGGAMPPAQSQPGGDPSRAAGTRDTHRGPTN